MVNILSNMIGKDTRFYNIGLKKKTASKRLSTGKRINNAADDVAGLAISISMESQIRGLKQADKNVIDGISLIQTADAALASVNNMLDRILELTLQASNGIYTLYDRIKMQDEVNQLTEEIDHISFNTEFNTRRLFDGSYGNKERQVFSKTLSVVEGIAHKPHETIGPMWESDIDLSKIKDGVILKINDAIFEFDSDDNIRSGGIPIKFTPKTSSSTNDVYDNLIEAIKNTLGEKENKIKAKLDSVDCKLSSGSNMHIEIKGNCDNIKGGETISVSMERIIPEIDTSDRTYNPADGVFGRELIINNIDLTKIVDGTTFSINGIVYEFDSDGVIDTGHKQIYVAGKDMSDSLLKTDAIINMLYTDFADFDGYIDFFNNGDIGDFIMSYNNYDTEDNQPLNVEFNSDIPSTDSSTYIKNIKIEEGIDKPEIKVRQAKRTDRIDFSMVSDGSVFNIDGYKFEFDSDGILSDSSNILVDISSVDTSEIAAAFKNAFDASVIAADYTLSVFKTDSYKSILEFSSSENSTADGQIIYVTYSNIGNQDDEVGLYLQIGSNCGSVNSMRLKIDSVSSSYLGIEDIDIMTEKKAEANIGSIYNAIDIVSENRAKLGAEQNVLEFTSDNLSIASNNLSVSKSRIMDADMAKEMMDLIRQNLLEQSVQKVLLMTMNFSKDVVLKLIDI